MNNLLKMLFSFDEHLKGPLSWLESIALLASRFYVAWVFFKAGLTKIRDWDTTLFLFEEEYVVPLLPPEIAAYLGTFGELFFPVLLILGLFSRFSALGLSVVNIVAVLSLEDIPAAALQQHISWGLMLAAVVIWGGGKISLDHLAKRYFGQKTYGDL